MLSSTVPSFRSPQKPRNLPHSHSSADSSSTHMPEKAKIRGSPQLNRWSRARSIRSGRRLDRKSMAAVTENPNPPVVRDASDFSDGSESSSDEEVVGKSIYMVSDGTGWTAEHSINAALAQFEHCLVDRVCPINTHLFSGIDDVERLVEIVKQAAKEGALLVYTLADSSMCEAAKSACKIWNVPSIDVLGPITEAISRHLEVSPLGVPRSGRNPLSEDYFKRIEAIEFTIKQDDGALPMNLKNADIILAGVSRTGKTPLSIYLAQKGYKVANIPIVTGVALPSSLFAVSPRKVFGLTINPLVLQAIRKARAKTLGLTADDQVKTNYAEMEYVREELQNARKIFSQNPTWPVIEVTGKAIEETAAIILRLFHDRNHKCSMPRISKRY